jgi:tetratricopeptide (TPR) repeat protein
MKTLLRVLLSVLLIVSVASAETKQAKDKLEKARKELNQRIPNVPRAEKLLVESLKLSPDYVDAQEALADLYYTQRRFDAAATEYQKARALDDSQKKLSREDRNQLLDQLGLSQAQGRHLDEAIATYKSAVSEDAQYALFEYNLACTYAEKGDLDTALPHLKKSWELRDNLPRGVQFPDPRKDDSFKRFWSDPRFQDAVVNMVV